VPAFNHPNGLRACLSALQLQSLPASQFEVIVVDDGSQPPVADIVEPFRDRLEVRCLRVSNSGPASARNQGARAAHGQYLAFTDHDCLPHPQWLTALLDGFRRHPTCLVGGPKHNGLPGNLYSTAHQIASNYAEQWFRDAAGDSAYFTTNNMAMPRQAFLQIGGFNEALPFAHEDREFGATWADHGLPARWLPEAVVVHNHELTLRAFLRQHFRYGVGAIEYRQARRQGPVRRRVPFAGPGFHLGFVLAPFTRATRRRFSLAALLAGAQLAYLAGAVLGGITTAKRSAI
jgi:GT2 family glycosyltransferase